MKTEELRDAAELVCTAMAASEGPLLSEQQFLRELVDFANTGVIGNVLASVPGLSRDVGALDNLHRTFRADLQSLVDDGRLSKADRRRIYRAADRVLMMPRTADDGALRYQYLPLSAESAVAHAMRLLIDPAKPQLREDLKQCQWRDCNRIEDARQLAHVRRFFFVSERREAQAAAGKEMTGKAPDRYCSPEHMRAAHRERATLATIKRRKKLKEAKAEAKAKAAAKRAAKASR